MLDSYKSCGHPALARIPSWRENAIVCRTEMSVAYEPAFDNFTTEFYRIEPTTTQKNLNGTVVDVFMERLALALNVYYTPVLIVLGCIGNILSIIVFYKSKLRVQSTSQYLSALAVSDTLFLLQLLPPWLKAVGSSTLFTQNGYCQLFVYLSYVTSHHSSWLVVAFTVERFVAVVYPLRRNAVCTVKRARHVIASLAAIALLLNLPVLRFVVPSGNDCNIDEPLMVHAARFNLLDTVISFTLPMALIVVLNAWIMAGVYRLGRARGSLMRQQRSCPVRDPPPGRMPRLTTLQRSQQRVTRMLLIVSTVFVLLNLPAYSMRIAAYANNMDERETSGRWAAVQQICLLFFNTNFGINFVLYCLSGQNFRRALAEIFPRLRRHNHAQLVLRELERAEPPRASSVSTLSAHSCNYNLTEDTSNFAASTSGSRHRRARRVLAGPGEVMEPVCPECPKLRRRRSPKVIQRWRFDNTRQRRESFEMLQYQQHHLQQSPQQNLRQYPRHYPHQYSREYPHQYPRQYPRQYSRQYSRQYPHQYQDEYQYPHT